MKMGTTRRFIGIDSVHAIPGIASGSTSTSDPELIGRIGGRITSRVAGHTRGVAGHITERLKGMPTFKLHRQDNPAEWSPLLF